MDTSRLIVLEMAYFHSAPVSSTLLDTREWGDFVVFYNRQPPGFSADQWADLLLDLHGSALIEFRRGAATCFPSAQPPLSVTRTLLMDALHDVEEAMWRSDSGFSYAVTPTGGAVWEDAAQADWQKYQGFEEGYGPDWAEVFGAIDKEEEPPPPDDEEMDEPPYVEDDSAHPIEAERAQVLLMGMNRDALEAAYRFEAETLGVVVPGSRQDGEVRPWHPVYWKTLPHGFRLGYSVYSPAEMREQNLPVKTYGERDDTKGFTPNWYRSVFPPHRWRN